MAFNVTGCEKFINMVSDSPLQLIFRKPSVVVFVLYQRRISTITERAIKTLYPFISAGLCEARFSSDASTQIAYCNTLNTEDKRIPSFLLNQTLMRFTQKKKENDSILRKFFVLEI